MKDKLVRFLKRFQKQPCPFCGECCISFAKRMQAANRWHEPKCPKCGAVMRIGGRYFAVKIAVYAVVIIAFVIITLNTDAYLFPAWKLLPITAIAVIEIFGALFAPLDYEENWKYPKNNIGTVDDIDEGRKE